MHELVGFHALIAYFNDYNSQIKNLFFNDIRITYCKIILILGMQNLHI
jgi:hypothetical protein